MTASEQSSIASLAREEGRVGGANKSDQIGPRPLTEGNGDIHGPPMNVPIQKISHGDRGSRGVVREKSLTEFAAHRVGCVLKSLLLHPSLARTAGRGERISSDRDHSPKAMGTFMGHP
jgi:hypothetical protein